MGLIKFGIKVGLLTGTVYFVSEQGVWKDSKTTRILYNNLKEFVAPYTQELTKQIPYELPKLPQTNEVSFLARYYWNQGVKASFSFISNIPAYTKDLSNKGIDMIMDNTEIKNMFENTAENKNV